MRPGIDFMQIPGTPKPSLLKPGAERLNRFMGFGATVECVRYTEDWDNGFVHYVYRAGVGPVDADGVHPRAYAEASANSKERKWARVSVHDVANTVQQVAEKRAYVAATRTATNTSDFFSQDLQDLPDELLRQEQPKPAASGRDEDMVITFGKYKGNCLGWIADENETYLPWLKGQLEKNLAEGKLPDDQLPLKAAVERLCA
jgi:uncharacterized protein (DUF3820 family)